MEFPVNATILDIIFIIFVILMLFVGYIRGFIARLYDFLATIAALLLSIFLSGPLSDIFHLYASSGIMMLVGMFVNRIFVFGILFSVFRMLFFIVGRFIKPGLKGVVLRIPFIKQFDHLLGVLLSLVEVVCITYVLLLVSISPVFNDGKEVVNDTFLVKHILNITSPISDQIMDMTNQFQSVKDIVDQGVEYDYTDAQSVSSMVSFLSGIKDTDLLSEKDTNAMIRSYIEKLGEAEESITVDKSTYDLLQELAQGIKPSNNATEKIVKEINVSE